MSETNGNRVSLRDNKDVLKLHCGYYHTTLNLLKSTETYILKDTFMVYELSILFLLLKDTLASPLCLEK
jgi:hypothetical protein